jgi:hypothetical protein
MYDMLIRIAPESAMTAGLSVSSSWATLRRTGRWKRSHSLEAAVATQRLMAEVLGEILVGQGVEVGARRVRSPAQNLLRGRKQTQYSAEPDRARPNLGWQHSPGTAQPPQTHPAFRKGRLWDGGMDSDGWSNNRLLPAGTSGAALALAFLRCSDAERAEQIPPRLVIPSLG